MTRTTDGQNWANRIWDLFGGLVSKNEMKSDEEKSQKVFMGGWGGGAAGAGEGRVNILTVDLGDCDDLRDLENILAGKTLERAVRRV